MVLKIFKLRNQSKLINIQTMNSKEELILEDTMCIYDPVTKKYETKVLDYVDKYNKITLLDAAKNEEILYEKVYVKQYFGCFTMIAVFLYNYSVTNLSHREYEILKKVIKETMSADWDKTKYPEVDITWSKYLKYVYVSYKNSSMRARDEFQSFLGLSNVIARYI